MRVITGSARGRRLQSPGPETRPMTDRAREALFSILGPEIAGARILDLYAGSASLSCEALSRGAGEAIIVEKSPVAVETAKANLLACGFADRSEIVACDVQAFAKRRRSAMSEYDLVFADPPYAVEDDAVCDLLDGITGMLATGALVVLHRRTVRAADDRRFCWPSGYRSDDMRVYGGTTLHFARYLGATPDQRGGE